MTTIQINCADCGTGDPVPAEALLASADIEDPDTHFAGAVSWICSGCRRLTNTRIDWHQLLLLITAGVSILDEGTDHHADRDLPPHPEHPSFNTGSFTADDILDLHELLAAEGWFNALTGKPAFPL
jgi:hypothetical protein